MVMALSMRLCMMFPLSIRDTQQKKCCTEVQHFIILFCSKRQQCDIACAFDCNRHLTLMLSAVAGDTTR